MNNKVYWTMRNGVSISVDDMDMNHLRNTLKMIIRNNQPKKEIGNIERCFKEDDLEYEYNNSFEDEC